MAEGGSDLFQGAWGYIVTGGGAVITALTGAVVKLWNRANKLSDEQNSAVVAALNNNTNALKGNAEVLANIALAITKMSAEQSIQNERLQGIKEKVESINEAADEMGHSLSTLTEAVRNLAFHARPSSSPSHPRDTAGGSEAGGC